MSGLLRAHLAMMGANIMWGMMAPVAKLTMAAGLITPLLLTDCRVFGAAALFWLLSLFSPREHVARGDMLRLAGAGLLAILCNQGCYIFGVGLTSPGEASIITTTMPMWVMLLAWLLLREPLTWLKAAGVATGAAGALMLVLTASGTHIHGANPMLGDLLVLTAQLCYALYLTLFRNFIRRYSLVTLMKWMFLFASIGLIPLSAEAIVTAPWEYFTAPHWMGIVYVVAGGTFVAYICVMIGQKSLRPTVVGMYNYLQPVIATVIGVALGMDRFTPVKILAVALIFTGVYMVIRSKAAVTDAQ